MFWFLEVSSEEEAEKEPVETDLVEELVVELDVLGLDEPEELMDREEPMNGSAQESSEKESLEDFELLVFFVPSPE